MRHPVLGRLVQALHVDVLSRQPHHAKSGRVFGAKPRIPANATLGACACKPGLGPFADQRAFELGRGAQDLQAELALRRGRVDGIGQ